MRIDVLIDFTTNLLITFLLCYVLLITFLIGNHAGAFYKIGQFLRGWQGVKMKLIFWLAVYCFGIALSHAKGGVYDG